MLDLRVLGHMDGKGHLWSLSPLVTGVSCPVNPPNPAKEIKSIWSQHFQGVSHDVR